MNSLHFQANILDRGARLLHSIPAPSHEVPHVFVDADSLLVREFARTPLTIHHGGDDLENSDGAKRPMAPVQLGT